MIKILVFIFTLNCLCIYGKNNKIEDLFNINDMNYLIKRLNNKNITLSKENNNTLKSMREIYLRINETIEEKQLIGLLGKIALISDEEKYKTPQAYLLRSEFQILASYIVYTIREKRISARLLTGKYNKNWIEIIELYNKITKTKKTNIYNIFNQIIPLNKTQSIWMLYKKIGKRILIKQRSDAFLKKHKISTYYYFFIVFLGKSKEEMKIFNKFVTNKKFNDINKHVYFSFTKVVENKMYYLMLRRYFFAKVFIIKYKTFFAKVSMKKRLLFKRDVNNLSFLEMKKILGEPKDSSITKETCIKNLRLAIYSLGLGQESTKDSFFFKETIKKYFTSIP